MYVFLITINGMQLAAVGGTGACYSHIIQVANMDVMPFQY